MFFCFEMTDIETKSHSSTRFNNSVWSKSDNSFKFDFIPVDCPAPVNPTSTASDEAEPARGWFPMKGQGSNFLFNFKIPPVEQMETTETQDISSQDNPEGAQEQTSQDVSSIDQVVLQTKFKKKKKKKSGKKQTSEPWQESGSAQVNEAGKDTELVSVCFAPKIHWGVSVNELMSEHFFQSAEEQLNRQLDWCIEQLELGMKSLKTTPKQSRCTWYWSVFLCSYVKMLRLLLYAWSLEDINISIYWNITTRTTFWGAYMNSCLTNWRFSLCRRRSLSCPEDFTKLQSSSGKEEAGDESNDWRLSPENGRREEKAVQADPERWAITR